MNNRMEWTGRFSAKNIRLKIYRRPSADAVGGQIWTFLPNDNFAINNKRHIIVRLYVCDIIISQSQRYPLKYGHFYKCPFGL